MNEAHAAGPVRDEFPIWRVILWGPPAIVTVLATLVAAILPALGNVAGGHGGDLSIGWALTAYVICMVVHGGLFLTPFALSRPHAGLRPLALVLLVGGGAFYTWAASYLINLMADAKAGVSSWRWEGADFELLRYGAIICVVIGLLNLAGSVKLVWTLRR